MYKLNDKAMPAANTHDFAGGEACEPELELVTILLTASTEDDHPLGFDTAITERVSHLLNVVNNVFAAKAIVYARTKYDARAIVYVAASLMSEHLQGTSWGRSFYRAVVNRPDDMMFTFEYHQSRQQKWPHAMRIGFGKAFDKFDGQTLLKYLTAGKEFNLRDVINICHPKPKPGKNYDELVDLIKNGWKGKLANTTSAPMKWQSTLARAGERATPETKRDVMQEAWSDIFMTGKIGYHDILKNLRNIIKQAPTCVPLATVIIKDAKKIRSILITPTRYWGAFREVKELDTKDRLINEVLLSLDIATDIALLNLPRFEGDTLVVLNTSKSMVANKVKEIAALFAATIVKITGGDFMVFGSDARYLKVNYAASTIQLSETPAFDDEGTNFGAIFETATRHYDRIIILSDNQGIGDGRKELVHYREKYGADPFIYSVDLKHVAPLKFIDKKVVTLGGAFHEKILSLFKLLEGSREDLLNEIHRITL